MGSRIGIIAGSSEMNGQYGFGLRQDAMFGHKTRILIPVAFLLLTAGVAFSAQTWHLEKGSDWRNVSEQSQGQYLLDVAEVKQLIETGHTESACEALEELKCNYPQIAGADLDAFIKAEILFSKDKFTKASKAYTKFLMAFPKNPLYDAALDRQFAIATAFMSGRKRTVLKVLKIKGHAEGIRVMERIIDRAGDAPIAVKAAKAIANNYDSRGKFNDAYDQWSYISSRWPTGRTGKEALLSMGRCKHAAYKGPSYDSSALISTKTYYENYSQRYPQDAMSLEIDRKLTQVNEQMAYKQLNIGQYYEKSGNKEAANLYYQIVIDGWPGTTAAKMAKERME